MGTDSAVGRLERKRPVGKPRRKQDDNILKDGHRGGKL